MRFEIWRFAVAPSDAAEKNCNIGAQLQSLTCIKAPKDVLENLIGAHKLVHSEQFLDYLDHIYELWHLLSALYRDLRKKIYIDAYLHSRPETTAVEFFQIPQLSIRSGAHKLFRRFLDFLQFWPPFLEICDAIIATKWESCTPSERPILLREMWKPHQNRLIKNNTIHVWSMHPSNEQRAGLGAWQAKKINIQTPCFRQWSNCKIRARGTLSLPFPFPVPPLSFFLTTSFPSLSPFLSPPLRSRPLKFF